MVEELLNLKVCALCSSVSDHMADEGSKADGNKYCNMHGHANGQMDYVWTLSTGKTTC